MSFGGTYLGVFLEWFCCGCAASPMFVSRRLMVSVRPGLYNFLQICILFMFLFECRECAAWLVVFVGYLIKVTGRRLLGFFLHFLYKFFLLFYLFIFFIFAIAIPCYRFLLVFLGSSVHVYVY